MGGRKVSRPLTLLDDAGERALSTGPRRRKNDSPPTLVVSPDGRTAVCHNGMESRGRKSLCFDATIWEANGPLPETRYSPNLDRRLLVPTSPRGSPPAKVRIRYGASVGRGHRQAAGHLPWAHEQGPEARRSARDRLGVLVVRAPFGRDTRERAKEVELPLRTSFRRKSSPAVYSPDGEKWVRHRGAATVNHPGYGGRKARQDVAVLPGPHRWLDRASRSRPEGPVGWPP